MSFCPGVGSGGGSARSSHALVAQPRDPDAGRQARQDLGTRDGFGGGSTAAALKTMARVAGCHAGDGEGQRVRILLPSLTRIHGARRQVGEGA